jgi:hypothetical protein
MIAKNAVHDQRKKEQQEQLCRMERMLATLIWQQQQQQADEDVEAGRDDLTGQSRGGNGTLAVSSVQHATQWFYIGDAQRDVAYKRFCDDADAVAAAQPVASPGPGVACEGHAPPGAASMITRTRWPGRPPDVTGETMDDLTSTYTDKKKEVDDEEEKAVEAHESHLKAKTSQMESAESDLADTTEELSQAMEEAGEAETVLSNANATMAEDTTYLQDQSSKMRADELTALNGALNVMKDKVAPTRWADLLDEGEELVDGLWLEKIKEHEEVVEATDAPT